MSYTDTFFAPDTFLTPARTRPDTFLTPLRAPYRSSCVCVRSLGRDGIDEIWDRVGELPDFVVFGVAVERRVARRIEIQVDGRERRGVRLGEDGHIHRKTRDTDLTHLANQKPADELVRLPCHLADRALTSMKRPASNVLQRAPQLGALGSASRCGERGDSGLTAVAAQTGGAGPSSA